MRCFPLLLCTLLCALLAGHRASGSSSTLQPSKLLQERRQAKKFLSVTASVATSKAKVGTAAAASHKMSMMTLIVNIVADLCPHGMLPLAYGISQGGPTGLVPALALLALFGSMSAYTMTSFAQMASETRSTSIGELWANIIGPKTKWVADLAVLSLCFGCCIFYSAFAGDIFGALSQAMGVSGILGRRWVVLALVSSLCLLPLCLLEDLSALQFSSVLGVAGIAYTLLFHALRAVDGSYAPGTALVKELGPRLLPRWSLGRSSKFSLWNLNSGAFVLVNMLCVAFLAHYNAINYYSELEGATPARYRRAVYTGFGISGGVFAGMMVLGYALFGSAVQPLILNNFHKSRDALATGARLATGLAITFAYPLMFNGVKSSLHALLPTKLVTTKVDGRSVQTVSDETRRLRTGAVIAALGAITSVAFRCGEEDVSLVLGVVGSVLGCGVAYVLPGYLGLVRQRARKAAGLQNSGAEVAINHALVGLGSVFGALGVFLTLKEAQHGHH